MQAYISKNGIKEYLQGFLHPNTPEEKERNECEPISPELRPGIEFCVEKILAYETHGDRETQFRDAVQPLRAYLGEYGDPHTAVIVKRDGATETQDERFTPFLTD